MERRHPPKVVHHSDVIDLTKDSPRPGRQSRRKCRPLSPIILGTPDSIDLSISLEECSVLLLEEQTRTATNPTCIISDDPKDTEKSNNPKCAICLEVLCSELQPTATRCGHVFCAKCLKECLNKKIKRCPTCKSSITLRTCIRLYL